MVKEQRPPDFVGFCGQDWWYHNRAHSDFQLLLPIADERKVLLINSIGLRMPTPGKSSNPGGRILRKLKSTLRFLKRPDPARPNLWVMTPVAVPLYGNRFLRWVNAWSIALQVRLVLLLKGFRKPHVLVTVPTAIDPALRIPHSSLLFNRSDKLSLYPEADTAMIEAFEERLLARADRVIYVSHALLEEERARTGDRAVFVDHGVQKARFERDDGVHPEVAAIPGPRIGFFGNIAEYRIDVELLRAIPVRFPDASLVLVGNIHEDLADLLEHENVHFLGFRTHEEIPSIGRGFDVGLMPWPRNEWIHYCNPIKLKEYLCLGIEIVSTRFPEIAFYEDVVHVAEDREHFLELVGAILEGRQEPRDEARRRAIVERSDWADRSAELVALAEGVVASGRAR